MTELATLRAALSDALSTQSMNELARDVGVVDETLRRFLREPARVPRQSFVRAASEWYDRTRLRLEPESKAVPSGDASTGEPVQPREDLSISHRYWTAVSQCITWMSEELERFEKVGTNSTAEKLRAYRELRARILLLNRLGRHWYETYLWTPTGEQKLEEFRRVCALNGAAFEQGLAPEAARVKLSTSEPGNWPEQLGVADLTEWQLAFRGATAPVIWKDRSGNLLCFFDQRLLDD